MLYHGSNSAVDFSEENPERDRYDVCLTPSKEIAETYGEELHEVRFDGYCSTPADVVEVADMYGLNDGPERIDADSPFFYLLLDDPEVQEALVKEGHEAVRYEDENIGNATHETIRVLEPGHITEA